MDRAKIAKRLVKCRGDRSQKEIAEAVGVTVMAISLYECGERVPRDEIKVKLANLYGMTIDELFYA